MPVSATRSVDPALSAGADSAYLNAMRAGGRKLDPHDPRVIRTTARQTVAEVFFAPLLAELRDFPFGREFLNGGQMESMFTERLHGIFAETVAASDRGGVVDDLVKRLENQAALRQGAAQAAASRGQSEVVK